MPQRGPGRRVEAGRLCPGDKLPIANLRYRLESGRIAEGSRLSPRADARGGDITRAPHFFRRAP